LSHITVKQLQDHEGTIYADNIYTHISSENILLWHALEELASMIELFLPLEDAAEIAPKAIDVLTGGREYFQALQVPRPYAVEVVLLQLERLQAGLDPFGQ
jgi:hypothetical protein